MSPRSWIGHQLEQLLAEHRHRAATVCGLLLLLAAVGLVLNRPDTSAVVGSEQANRTPALHASGSAAPRWTLATSAATKSTAERFLAGYLAYLYGRAPASTVQDATGAFVRILQHEPLRVPPGIRGLHPRVVGVNVSPQPPGRAIALALVSDAEVVHYPIRLTLTQTGSRWRVSGLQGTP